MSRLQYACFVTGTDTEIGKTLVASALLHKLAQGGWQTVGMKPVAAGAFLQNGIWKNEDAESLLQASSLKAEPALRLPYLLHEAAAPHIAAAHAGVHLSIPHMLDCYRQLTQQADAVVVEGVGGFCVPLDAQHDTADLAQALNLPVILVVGMRLGCISHALLTAAAIQARGLTLAGWVANTLDPEMGFFAENLQALVERLPAPLLGVIPRLPAADATLAAQYLTGFQNSANCVSHTNTHYRHSRESGNPESSDLKSLDPRFRGDDAVFV